MRYIDIHLFIDQIPAPLARRLARRHKRVHAGNDQVKQTLIRNGNITWRDVKQYLEGCSNRKCWYTESQNPGFPNDVEHFRPKGRIVNEEGEVEYWYWFLAFDPMNYRLSCQFTNRLNINPETNLTGGKGEKFPLLNGQAHAMTLAAVANENPVLLDPCNQADCELLDFLPDGRPIVSATNRDNVEAVTRVDQSKLLLNLDYPTFNEDREALYNEVKDLVERGDRYGPDNPAFEDVIGDLMELMDEESPYSKAAECYIRGFREREWVEELLFDRV